MLLRHRTAGTEPQGPVMVRRRMGVILTGLLAAMTIHRSVQHQRRPVEMMLTPTPMAAMRPLVALRAHTAEHLGHLLACMGLQRELMGCQLQCTGHLPECTGRQVEHPGHLRECMGRLITHICRHQGRVTRLWRLMMAVRLATVNRNRRRRDG